MGFSRLLGPWDSPGKNTEVGCHALLQGIFPTQGLNVGLLRCRRIVDRLSRQETPPGSMRPYKKKEGKTSTAVRGVWMEKYQGKGSYGTAVAELTCRSQNGWQAERCQDLMMMVF